MIVVALSSSFTDFLCVDSSIFTLKSLKANFKSTADLAIPVSRFLLT